MRATRHCALYHFASRTSVVRQVCPHLAASGRQRPKRSPHDPHPWTEHRAGASTFESCTCSWSGLGAEGVQQYVTHGSASNKDVSILFGLTRVMLCAVRSRPGYPTMNTQRGWGGKLRREDHVD